MYDEKISVRKPLTFGRYDLKEEERTA